MDPIWVGSLIVGALLVLVFLGGSIASVATLLAIAGIVILEGFDVGARTAGFRPFSIVAREVYTVLPAFLIMGTFAGVAGLTRDLFETARAWVGHFRGGMAIAAVATCTGFAACSGTSTATAAVMGKTVVPEMRRYGYSARMATGLVAVGGTLAILIPPSVAMVIYGVITEQSIGALLVAGFLPGMVTAINYVIIIMVMSRVDPGWAPALPPVSWKERWLSLRKTWGMLILIGIVMGGIYTGIFTPTESGAVGAAAAFLIALFLRRVNWTVIKETLLETTGTTGMVFAIIIGIILFVQFLALSGTAAAVTQFVVTLPFHRMMILIIILLLYVILGCFMDAIGMMLLTLPFVFPVIKQLGFDPIWFGIIVVKMCEICLITPPVGMNVFMVKSVCPDVPLSDIFRGTFPFLTMEFVTLAILIAFPQIVLFLPNMMRR